MSDDVQTESLAVTENYAAWISTEPDGEVVYHLELGSVTVHYFQEEWADMVKVIHAAKIPRREPSVIEQFTVWVDESEGEAVYHLELGDATVYLAAEDWDEVVELVHAAEQQAAKRRSS